MRRKLVTPILSLPPFFPVSILNYFIQLFDLYKKYIT